MHPPASTLIGFDAVKLNALKAVVAIGDMPQNVNFAIKAGAPVTFLESTRIGFQATANSTRLTPPDLADAANSISIFIRCE
ncbi:hypothetical protein AB4Y85_04340 [Microvirga sp. 2YAF29]|uniref:hypothetical protein n=1 Tax=Microvirga sp. 2YAF29 TaxID=3233031 RepID=UPI003F9E8CB8